ncbi:MAG TPA: inositol monophosphatase family protein [Steroidobacteraceae bacterium]|jgi:fructose-1,6-bisphosphatase/inositol monophosphatase family enzyme|nr:inositol monophosphatase family protein [Steroidobacteraceae bacterium]
MDLPLEELLERVRLAVTAPAGLILEGFRNPQLHTDLKADGSVVTRYDRESEQLIRQIVGGAGPWPVLGEEFGWGGGAVAPATHRWVLDPIDGTLGYTRGLPTFGTLLAFESMQPQRALVGAIHLPVAVETYSAGRGLGAWCNGAPIHVAPDRDFQDCIVAHVPAANFARAHLAAGFERLMRAGTHLRGCHDCWSHAHTARGAIDALVELGLNRWDIAATEVIVEEAGGACRIRPSHYAPDKYDVVVGNVRAVDEVVRLLDFEADLAA